MPKKVEIAEEEPKTKKGQKPRTLTPEHLEKLKVAREKARITQKKNTELRKLDRENVLHEKTKEKAERERGIKAKNKEIKVEEKEKEEGEEEEEEVTEVKKTKKKSKKKPVIIVQASSESESDDQQVIYIKNKSKKKERKPESNQQSLNHQLTSASEPEYQPQHALPVQTPRQYPINPFFNTHYKHF